VENDPLEKDPVYMFPPSYDIGVYDMSLRERLARCVALRSSQGPTLLELSALDLARRQKSMPSNTIQKRQRLKASQFSIIKFSIVSLSIII